MNPAKVPRVRKELLDMDYLNQLSSDELEWMAQFMDEYVGGNVRKTKNGKVKAGHIHNTKQLAKDCYDMNNKRNNDVHSVTKANGLLGNIDNSISADDGWYVHNADLTEQAIIAEIDRKKKEET